MERRKIKIISIVSVILIIAVITLSVIQFFISSKNTNDIETINIETNYGYLSPTYTYKINFLDNSIMYKIEDANKNETSYTKFSDKDAKTFVKKANLYGFFQWNDLYESPNTDDGKYVNICIRFKDGSIKEILCYAKFPFTYDKMAEVFYEAFGYNIL
ncbi:MAG: hypothetical protein J6B75_02945 [Ruminococcus sp.]|nr:hypothetical protein [Ruminococcus sp.]